MDNHGKSCQHVLNEWEHPFENLLEHMGNIHYKLMGTTSNKLAKSPASHALLPEGINKEHMIVMVTTMQ